LPETSNSSQVFGAFCRGSSVDFRASIHIVHARTLSNVSLSQLKRAVQLKEQIEKLQSELTSIVGGGSEAKAGSGMSEATKAKLRAAAKARWAQIRGNKGQKSAAMVAKKPVMSAAAKTRLSKLAKARWAKVKAAGKNAL
jgi:hypothetical protein